LLRNTEAFGLTRRRRRPRGGRAADRGTTGPGPGDAGPPGALSRAGIWYGGTCHAAGAAASLLLIAPGTLEALAATAR